MTWRVAWAKVGTEGTLRRDAALVSRFSAKGFRPSAMADLLEAAIPLAWAILTVGKEPSPMSRRRPSMTIRWTQELEPGGSYVQVEAVAVAMSAWFADGFDLKCGRFSHAPSLPTSLPTPSLGFDGTLREAVGRSKKVMAS